MLTDARLTKYEKIVLAGWSNGGTLGSQVLSKVSKSSIFSNTIFHLIAIDSTVDFMKWLDDAKKGELYRPDLIIAFFFTYINSIQNKHKNASIFDILFIFTYNQLEYFYKVYGLSKKTIKKYTTMNFDFLKNHKNKLSFIYSSCDPIIKAYENNISYKKLIKKKKNRNIKFLNIEYEKILISILNIF
jgi:hypothetical protein